MGPQLNSKENHDFLSDRLVLQAAHGMWCRERSMQRESITAGAVLIEMNQWMRMGIKDTEVLLRLTLA